MLYDNYFLLQSIGLKLLFAGIFFFMAMSIRDVLRQSKVPPFGRMVVWGVLCFGSLGFIVKGILELYFSLTGLG